MLDTASPPSAMPIPPASLDINDIANAVKIIDYCADQGSFKGWETINGVKQVRDRLFAFIESIPKPSADQSI